MSGLVTFSLDRQECYAFEDPLKEATEQYFQERKVSETLLFRCAEHLSFSKANFYPSLCALLLLRKLSSIKNEKLDQELKALISLGKREFLGKTLTIQKGYEALALYLLHGSKTNGLDFKQLEKGGVLFGEPFPHLLENAKIGVIACYLGREWDDEELLSKGNKLCDFFHLLTNHKEELFLGIWVPEEDYHEELLETVDLLMGRDRFFQSPYLRLMKEAIGKNHLSLSKGSHSMMDRSLGFLKYQWGGDTSFVSSVAGKNTGLASIQKHEVSIVSMGPHFVPLADTNYYGVFRPSNGSQEGFKDLTIQLDEERGKIEGWTRIISPGEGGLSQSWLYFDLQGQKDDLSLTVRKSHETKQDLYFVFFVSADQGRVEEGTILFPKALHRFEGTSQKISFEKGESLLEIIPHFESEMKLIPLAGGSHFWSADFLLAFAINEKLAVYSWTVK